MSPGNVGRITSQQLFPGTSRTTSSAGSSDFGSLLKVEQDKQDLKLSAHARKRLEQGNVELTPNHQERLREAVSKMEEKGADKSLVLMDGLALVVSVKNKTVITALDENRSKEGVFTNIDSAIII